MSNAKKTNRRYTAEKEEREREDIFFVLSYFVCEEENTWRQLLPDEKKIHRFN